MPKPWRISLAVGISGIYLMLLASPVLAQLDAIVANEEFSQRPFRFGLELRNFTIFQKNYAGFPVGGEVEGFNLTSLRAKADWQVHQQVALQLHLVQNSLLKSEDTGVNFNGFSVTGTAGSFLIDDLTQDLVDEEAALVTLFPDRLALKFTQQSFGVALGRQAVTFGRTFFWNPIDWIAPFTQNTLDRSYKAGADVVRIDLWLQRFTALSFFYAFGADANWDESALFTKFSTNVHHFDVDLLLGKVKEDLRFGYGISGTAAYLGGGALRTEGTYYLATESGEDDFFRATVGYDYQVTPKLFLLSEYYFNGFGSSESEDFPLLFLDPRFVSGDITNVGRHYLAGSGRYEVTPLLDAEASVIINLLDGSLTLSPSLRYSVADEVELNLGSLIALGSRPQLQVPTSEFGTYPSFFWLELTLSM